jgi:hypothetical protein
MLKTVSNKALRRFQKCSKRSYHHYATMDVENVQRGLKAGGALAVAGFLLTLSANDGRGNRSVYPCRGFSFKVVIPRGGEIRDPRIVAGIWTLCSLSGWWQRPRLLYVIFCRADPHSGKVSTSLVLQNHGLGNSIRHPFHARQKGPLVTVRTKLRTYEDAVSVCARKVLQRQSVRSCPSW